MRKTIINLIRGQVVKRLVGSFLVVKREPAAKPPLIEGVKLTV
jgi:hypothetical protein